MEISQTDMAAIWLTLRLASTVTLLLLLIGTPMAWWLSQTRSKLKAPIAAFLALPLILPPTVIGFYLLVAMAPDGVLGQLTNGLGLGSLAFSFWGLVLASMIYSLPFVVQPLHNAFEAIGARPLEVAATLRATPIDRFFSVVMPLAKPGFISAAILGFAHTVGEFGVVLMIGGNIPYKTQVISVKIYEHVELFEYEQAHYLSVLMMGFSFVVLLGLYLLRGTKTKFGMRF
ncbi:MAG: molybdate ABC transporter permease subunit [Alphaproteobacteria bacterium]|nr:molybdate ABC transporter permease subunit [Alphaproteobacteria bacterium]